MEAVFDGCVVSDVFGGGAACVEVGVDGAELVEDEKGLVAVDLALRVVSFEGVGFDDEEGVVVEGCDLGGLPSEEVDVDVSVPLSDNNWFAFRFFV